ncbi:MAG: hypothetical protein RLZZ08_393 [Pseudomonadota bacterium]|jgi:hypothetical protein
MLLRIAEHSRRHLRLMLAALAVVAAPVPLLAQGVQKIDPNAAIDADLATPPAAAPTYQDRATDLPPESLPQPAAEPVAQSAAQPVVTAQPVQSDPAPSLEAADAPPVVTSPSPSVAASQASAQPALAAGQGDTYKHDDLIGAAEGVFGKGAEGLARMIEDILKKQGEPNGYIVGREGGGALFFGVRYGSGTLYHKVEGQRPVYWTGPSIGLDAGGNVGNTFVLVYNLYDTEELFERYPAGEGQAYLLGGFNASYMRRGNVVLIPIRVGAGLRLGVNAGYMKFSKKQRWLPF